MIRRSKEQWLALFQQHAESGLTAAAFCKQRDLDQAYFSLRKKQLLSSMNSFVRVVKPSGTKKMSVASEQKTSLQCRLGSCVLQFGSLPDVVWLSQLIKALS